MLKGYLPSNANRAPAAGKHSREEFVCCILLVLYKLMGAEQASEGLLPDGALSLTHSALVFFLFARRRSYIQSVREREQDGKRSEIKLGPGFVLRLPAECHFLNSIW
jgi:hypothetical protein